MLVQEIVPFQAPKRPTVGAARLRELTRPLPGERRVTVAEPVGDGGTVGLPSPIGANHHAPSARARRAASRPRGLRRLLPGVATLAVLVSAWLSVGALAGVHRPELSVPKSAVKVNGSFVYVARPGDSLWSIASKLEPGGDPRILVAAFEQQLHGSELVPGDELKIP